jgi:hypothetical protein
MYGLLYECKFLTIEETNKNKIKSYKYVIWRKISLFIDKKYTRGE